jgi:hypothetical protein
MIVLSLDPTELFRCGEGSKLAICLRVIGTEILMWRVKQSHYRPGQTLRVPVRWGSQILRLSAHEGGKVVSPTHRPPLPPWDIPGTHLCFSLSHPRSIVRPEGLCQWKISVTPSEIDPATFRFVAKCLNHCASACLPNRNEYQKCFLG